MTPFEDVVRSLHDHRVRFVLIGVAAANYWAESPGDLFATLDRDLLLPLDPDNLLQAWSACGACGLSLWVGDEPLDHPRDHDLAERVVSTLAMTRATDGDIQVDLTLVMAGFSFDQVWSERRAFRVAGVDIPVARLRQVVESKAAAGRDKDRLFLATHADTLRRLLERS